MCTRLRKGTGLITPGVLAQYRVLSGILQGKFGLDFGQGPILNAREESLHGFWHKKDAQRGIIEVDEFYEKNVGFGMDGPMKVGCLYMPSHNFVIVTTAANNVVLPYHHRMPLIIGDEAAWLNHGHVLHGGHNLKTIAA